MIFARLIESKIRDNKNKYIFIALVVMVVSLAINSYYICDKITAKNRENELRNGNFNSQIIVSCDGYISAKTYEAIYDKINHIDNISNITPVFEGYIYSKQYGDVFVLGQVMDNILDRCKIDTIDGSFDNINKNNIAISRDFSDENNISINSEIKLEDKSYRVAAIFEKTNNVAENNYMILSDIECAQAIFECNNQYSGIYIALESISEIEDTKLRIEEAVSGFDVSVQEAYSASYYDMYVNTIKLALGVIIVLLLTLTIYVLVSVMSVFVIEDRRDAATLRSIGMPIRMYRRLIIWQVEIVSFIGTLLGIALSYPICSLYLKYIVKMDQKIDFEIATVVFIVLIMGLLIYGIVWFAIYKNTSSSLLSIIKKERKIDSVRRTKKWKMVLVIVFAGVYLFGYLKNNIIIMLLTLVSGIFLIAYMQDYLMNIFGRIISRFFKKFSKISYIFSRQIHQNFFSYKSVISVTTIVIIIGMLGLNTADSLRNTVATVYKGADVLVESYDENADKIEKIIMENGDTESYIIQKRCNVKLENKKVIISGVNPGQYAKREYDQIKGNRLETFSKLNNKNTIIITSTFAKTLGKKVGSYIIINGKEMEIVGVVNSIEQMGTVLFVSLDTFDDLFDYCDYRLWLINVNNNVESYVNSFIKNCATIDGYNISSIEKIVEENVKNDEMIFLIIYFLLSLAILVSIVALLSNLEINFQIKKNDFFIYKAVGLTKKNISKLQMLEALSGGIYASLVGAIGGVILLPCILNILSFYVGYVNYHINWWYVVGCILFFCLLNVICMKIILKKYIFDAGLIDKIRELNV